LVALLSNTLSTKPVVWAITNGHPGNTVQIVGLAEALGWDYEIKELRFSRRAKIRRYFMISYLFPLFGLDRKRSSPLEPPWPDVVIGVGRSTAPVTSWIGRRSAGATRTIHLGRGGGPFINAYDAVITPLHCQMPSDNRRYEILLPLNPVSDSQLSEAQSQWPGLLEGMPRPVVLLLVGGDASHFRLDANYARDMAKNVLTWAENSGGSMVAVTSRRTSKSAIQALASVCKPPHRLHRWEPNQKENPYYAFLAQADILVVTGESESMLAEAASTDKPLYIYPIPEVSTSVLRARFKKFYTRHANAHFSKTNNRSFGARLVDAACAWFMRLGGLIPGRDMNILHKALYASGRAYPFGEPLVTGTYQSLREAEVVAKWIQNVITTC
jgi:mitochondrial fission protein ELM1